MTSLKFNGITAVTLALALSPALIAQKGPTLPDFSATEVTGTKTWKVYHSGSKLRVEPSPAAATIFAPEEDKVYNLLILPEKTTCIVMKTAQAKMMRSPLELAYGANAVRTSTGSKEVEDGHTCSVLEAVTTLSDGSKVNTRIWAADDLQGAPVRIDLLSDRGALKTTFRDIVLGAPDASLFKLPATCIPHEKTYQIAPNKQLPGKPGDPKGPK